jgi:hypothetical protein
LAPRRFLIGGLEDASSPGTLRFPFPFAMGVLVAGLTRGRPVCTLVRYF